MDLKIKILQKHQSFPLGYSWTCYSCALKVVTIVVSCVLVIPGKMRTGAQHFFAKIISARKKFQWPFFSEIFTIAAHDRFENKEMV
jgi:hypothetical protein